MSPAAARQTLYGRENAIAALLASFERVAGGHGEVVLVPGLSGIGKTALVQELRDPVRARNGYFVSGKFDQFQQSRPYAAFGQALAELCATIQANSPRQREQFKAEILQGLGRQGQILVDLVPGFGAFLGAQPALAEVSPQETRHRFGGACRDLLKVVCRPEHPLVLFIDDWQWADAASCELLKQIDVENTLRYLLVIVSYRSDELVPSHPLVPTLGDLGTQSVPVTVVSVDSIAAGDVCAMALDILRPAVVDADGLASFVHRQTSGNPFFVRSYLTFMRDGGLLWFDAERQHWCWRPDQSGSAGMPTTLVQLFTLKLHRLDDESRRLFALAACLGNRFDLRTLSVVSGHSAAHCLALLLGPEARSLVLPFDAGDRTEATAAAITCEFLHDRVQQAARALIEPGELPAVLLGIGRQLLATLSAQQLAERLFEVVDDMNAGAHLLTGRDERARLVALNVSASAAASAKAAYRTALGYSRSAGALLDPPAFAEYLWRDHHALATQLFEEWGVCEFLEGDHVQAERAVRLAVTHACSPVGKAQGLGILIVQYTLLAKYPDAITAGRQALAELGVALPERDYEAARDHEIAEVRRGLRGRTVAGLADLPLMSDPAMLMIARILITMGPPCYRAHPRLWSVIVPMVVNLTLTHGNIPQVGYSHTAFGGLLGWVDDDYATAREFGELATRLMTDAFSGGSDQSVFHLMIGSSIRHWSSHLRSSSQDYAAAYESGSRSGNLQYAAYAFGHNMYCRFYQGTAFELLIPETRRSLEFSRFRVNQWAIDLLEGGLHVFAALIRDQPAMDEPAAADERDYLQRVAEHHNSQVTCIYQVLRTCSWLVLGDHERALALSDATEPLIAAVGTQGLLPWPEHVFARLLILTALYAQAGAERQAQWRPQLERGVARLRLWADHCQDNFEHKYLLVAAELARIDGASARAAQLFDEAIESARASGFVQWRALANERASEFWAERGKERLAHVYWQQAYLAYAQWGAVAKLRSMEAAYRSYLADAPTPEQAHGAGGSVPGPELNALAGRQVEQVRALVREMQPQAPQRGAASQTEELERAMQRMRMEIAERKRAEQELRLSTAALSVAQRIGQIGDWVQDHVANEFSCSAEILRIVEREARALVTRADLLALCHPADLARLHAVHLQSLRAREPYEVTYRLLLPGNRVKHVIELGETSCDDAGQGLRTVGTMQDITRRVQAEQVRRQLDHDVAALSEANAIAAAVIQNSAEGVMVIDPALRIESVNPAFERITGYAAAEVIGRSPGILFSGRHDAAFFRRLREQVDADGHWSGEIWNRRRDGALYPQQTSINVLRDASGQIRRYASVFSDGTERHLLEAGLRELSSTDGLTGVANRRSFDEVLLRECAHARRDGKDLSLIIADIDYFKRYNDHYGHPAGDACLQQVAAAIRGVVHRATDLVARYGGEEFAVILPDTDAAAAAVVAERVRDRVAALALPHERSAAAPSVTVSIGVATLEGGSAAGAPALLAAADRAMYDAKRAGRNRVVGAI